MRLELSPVDFHRFRATIIIRVLFIIMQQHRHLENHARNLNWVHTHTQNVQKHVRFHSKKYVHFSSMFKFTHGQIHLHLFSNVTLRAHEAGLMLTAFFLAFPFYGPVSCIIFESYFRVGSALLSFFRR